MRLILIRHGKSEFNAGKASESDNDLPLTERGREQARVVAQHFANETLMRSTQVRCSEHTKPHTQLPTFTHFPSFVMRESSR
jgi:broad specificity phosphatase PhoE